MDQPGLGVVALADKALLGLEAAVQPLAIGGAAGPAATGPVVSRREPASSSRKGEFLACSRSTISEKESLTGVDVQPAKNMAEIRRMERAGRMGCPSMDGYSRALRGAHHELIATFAGCSQAILACWEHLRRICEDDAYNSR
ncbi:hypothetical protein GN330_10620 [Nitratireductor sp. CAU 1489]|uniref:Uncharacterized protein n=1 Tax=Nitratireductor arenosus TaxID=2682096 RepID=A0A844QI16_9HYPH|nr:hypothetical protein [Nitratireductor arenosus]MVA97698.1 hypothetical protein [Nitratireductor arenosus]